ncbi:hypothetical protein [Pseudomonas xanthosomatis]|uniref:hypothetical protein n=1 Tax=Pseudomonas xanthosomatis TaxID=2842356 RepID=UPI0035144550
MTYPYQELEAAGVDIAALVNEKFLNKFSVSHHKTNSNLYEGADHTDELGDRVEIKFKVGAPLVFDLNPISQSRFRGIYESHLVKKGMNPKLKSNIFSVPANLKLCSEKVSFEVAVIDLQSGADIVRVPFFWDLEARCAVTLVESGGVYSVRLDPIKVEFSIGEPAALFELRQSLLGGKDSSGTVPPRKYSAPDPEWCIKIERLILLLVNKVIAVQLSNFIRSWELPKAIELVEGVDFKPSYLDVKANYLALGGHVTMAPISASAVQAKASVILEEYARRVQEEFDAMTDDQIRNIKSSKLKSVEWLSETTASLGAEIVGGASSGRSSQSSSAFDKNVSLLIGDKPIDYLAKKELTVRDGSNSSIQLDRALKAEAGWWLNIFNVSGGVAPGGLWVKATPDVGGYARVCHFDIDPKNFGQWKCHGPAVQLILRNAKFSAFPSFESDGVYLRGRFSSDGVEVRIPGWPSWANDLLAWVTRALSDPIIDFLGVLLSLFKVRIVEYPKHFPGTGLEWVPNINTTPGNVNSYLEFSADPTFE